MRANLFIVIASLLNIVIAALSNKELVTLSKNSKQRIIHINDANYKTLLEGPRDYHMVVLMTSTSSSINCVLCTEFKPEYELVSSSWFQDHPEGLTEEDLEVSADEEGGESLSKVAPKNIYFLYSEFTDSREFFGVFQLNNIPKVFYFPPSTNTEKNAYLKESLEYQFFAGSHKDLLIDWLKQLTGHEFPIYIPPDYTKLVTNIVGALAFLSLSKIFHKQLLKVLTSKIIWSGLSLIFILLLTSGYMFNQIRGVPYVRELGGGKIEYILAQQQNQYGVETQILSFVYGCLSLFMVILVKKVPELKNSQVQFITVVIFSFLIFFFYAILVGIFGLKGAGYPFKLLRMMK
ncbi:dolichyl-diphosphooligosaccharide--protein glycosyltransferase subunit 3 [[Candida] railenensis]|uniref:Dolichyl-diphosphooligosaccharide--protein glycosyltransferase subunit 3 n=1 Tax=[Candida] railenensis TaxID=45579 RepID=A0A9P0QR35_9ASCO|nr:dolichyl-diphosphooligosaccharide--protein glycosyltransferase subunit 3 [[Candida] railenensis]